MPKQTHLFEVLTRRPDGHETVVRIVAGSEAEARKAVRERGFPEDQVVEAAAPNVA